MKKSFIAIYEANESENLAHIVSTLEEASKWLGCTVDALFKSMHLYGRMIAKGYYVERVKE